MTVFEAHETSMTAAQIEDFMADVVDFFCNFILVLHTLLKAVGCA